MPKVLRIVWIVLCILASIGAGVGGVFLVRSPEPWASVPCWILFVAFAVWSVFEIYALRESGSS